jgi:prepilin-type N-terminal cleavage/methylation domain-containing protein
MRTQKSEDRGFTLIEVIVAMLVLTAGLLAMAAGGGWAARSVDSAWVNTERANALQAGIERVRATPFEEIEEGSLQVGRYQVTWSEQSSSDRATVLEFQVEGPGVQPGVFGLARVGASVSSTFSYSVVR